MFTITTFYLEFFLCESQFFFEFSTKKVFLIPIPTLPPTNSSIHKSSKLRFEVLKPNETVVKIRCSFKWQKQLLLRGNSNNWGPEKCIWGPQIFEDVFKLSSNSGTVSLIFHGCLLIALLKTHYSFDIKSITLQSILLLHLM